MDRDDLMEVKSIQNAVIELKLLMVENSKDLKEHMRRTELLEGHVSTLNAELVKLKTLFMVIGWLGGALGILGQPLLQWWLSK